MNKFEEVIENLTHFHSYDVEFQQAVKEVFEDIHDVYNENEKYKIHNVLEVLTEPDRIIRFRVQWMDDSGSFRVNRAWRVQYSNCLGAYKGGLRFHKSVKEDTLKFLGFEQSFKNALTDFPMGGAKGGSDFDPKGKSDNEILRFCHAFMDELHRHIGPEVDVPAGDIGVGSREIGYLFGRYLKIKNKFNGTITGKSPTYFGSCAREEATGYGCVYMLENVLKEHDLELKDKTICISGSGNVAIFAAQKAIELKAKVLTRSDSDGTIYFKDGISKENLEAIKTLKFFNRKRLSEYNGSGDYEYKASQNPWSIKAQITMPCATPNEMAHEDAKNISKHKYEVVIEGANMPLTKDATDIIMDSKIIYVPGKIANAGGVAISNLERSQNAQLIQWSFKEVDEKLKDIMKNIHANSVKNIEKEDGVFNYKKGSNIYGFKKIADAIVAYGLV